MVPIDYLNSAISASRADPRPRRKEPRFRTAALFPSPITETTHGPVHKSKVTRLPREKDRGRFDSVFSPICVCHGQPRVAWPGFDEVATADFLDGIAGLAVSMTGLHGSVLATSERRG